MYRKGLGLLLLPVLLTVALLAACMARPQPDFPARAEVSARKAAPEPRAWPPPQPLGAPAAATVTASPATEAWPPVARALDGNCRPCHFPGGKMYERMPFDDPATVRARGPGIAKRLKGEDLIALQALLAASG